MPTPKVFINGQWISLSGEVDVSSIIAQANQYTDSEISAVNTDVIGLNNYVDGAFHDGILTNIEINRIKGYLNTLATDKAKYDQDYTSLDGNAQLSATDKQGLEAAYNYYQISYADLVSFIEQLLNQNTVSSTDSSTVDQKFQTLESDISLMETSIQTGINDIAQAKADVVSGQLTEKVDGTTYQIDMSNITNQFTSVNNDISGATGYINTSFKDGILTSEEIKKIESYLLTLANDQFIINQRYTETDNDSVISATDKSNLETAYTGYMSAYNQFVTDIDAVINSDTVTAAQQTQIDTDISNYQNALSLVTQMVEVAAKDDALIKAQAESASALTNAKQYTDAQLGNYVEEAVYSQDVQTLQAQIDNQVDTWYGQNDPSLSNDPADTWTTDTDRDQHIGDMFLNISTNQDNSGQAWRFIKNGTEYEWQIISDNAIAAALQQSVNAQTLAEGKRRTFLNQPTPPYDTGDLWVVNAGSNNPQVWNCITAEISGASFNISDWQQVGDVTALNTAYDTAQVNGIDSGVVIDRLSTAEANITTAQGEIALKVSQTDYNGNTIASLLNQTATTILLNASEIDLAGQVDFSAFTSDVTTKLSGLNADGSIAAATDIGGTPASTVVSNASAGAQANDTVNNLQIGGTNLINNSNFANGLTNWTLNTGTNNTSADVVTDPIYGHMFHANLSGQFCKYTQTLTNVVQGNYTMSAIVKISDTSLLTGVGFVFHYTDSTYTDYTWETAPHVWNDLGNGYYKVVTTGASNTAKTISSLDVRIWSNEAVQTVEYWVGQVKFEQGDKATDFSLSLTDQQAYTDTAVSNIEIGGVNLALGTATPVAVTGTGGTNQTANVYTLDWNQISGHQVTLSFDMISTTATGDCWIQLGADPWTSFIEITSLSTTSQHYTTTITLPTGTSTATSFRIRLDNVTGSVTISNLMLEFGNKETTYQPAPADTQSQIDAVNSQISDMANDNKLTPIEKQSLDKDWQAIQGEKPTIDSNASALNVSAASYDNAYNTLNSYITPLLSNLTITSDVTGSTLRTNFTNYYNAKIAIQTSIDNAYTNSAVNNVQIGGTNLAMYSNFTVGSSNWDAWTSGANHWHEWSNGTSWATAPDVITDSTSPIGSNVMHWVTSSDTGQGGLYYQATDLSGGTAAINGNTITISVWAKGSGSLNFGREGATNGTTNVSLTSSYTKYSWTIDATNNTGTNSFHFYAGASNEVYLAGIKIELGNKSTAWSSDSDDQQAYTDSVSSAAAETGLITTNPNFVYWQGGVPVGTAPWAAGYYGAKETGITLNGISAIRFSGMGTNPSGIYLSNGFYNTNIANTKYLVVSLDFYLVSGSAAGAGVLIDWSGMSPYRAQFSLQSSVSSTIQTGKWYHITRTIQRPTDTLTGYAKMEGYLMANYPFSGESSTSKDLIYGSLAVRQASQQEIDIFTGKSGWDGTSTTVSNNQSTWSLASNINSDGTFSTTKLKGTVTDTQIASSGVWNTANTLLNSWKSGTTEINGGMIATNTVYANSIAIGDFTNIVAGSDFEDPNANPWTMPAGYSIDTAQHHSGSHSLKIVPTSNIAQTNSKIHVNAGDSLHLDFWMITTSDYNGTSDNSKVRFYSATNGSLLYAIAFGPASTTWKEVTATLYFSSTDDIYVSLPNNATAGSIWLDDIVLRHMMTGNLIVDGAIDGQTINGVHLSGGDINIGGGTFHVDSNGYLTAANATVTNGSFFIEDDTTQIKYNVQPLTNLIIDYSYENLAANTSSLGSYTSYNIYSLATDSTQRDVTGSTWHVIGAPYGRITTYQTPGQRAAIFGLDDLIVNSSNYMIYDWVVPTAGQTYTLSAYFRKCEIGTGGIPQFKVQIVHQTNTSSVVWSQTYTAPSAVATDYSISRYAMTFTLPTSYALGYGPDASPTGYYFEYLVMSSNGNWVEVDGVQMVEGSNPTVFISEDVALRQVQNFTTQYLTANTAVLSSLNVIGDASVTGAVTATKAVITGGSGLTTPDIELRAAGGTPYLDFSNDASSDYTVREIVNSSGTLQIKPATSSNTIQISSSDSNWQNAGTYNATSSSGANMVVGPTGWYYRSTSASKYKEDMEYNVTDDYANRILNLRPISWHDKAADEALANALENGDFSDRMLPMQRYYGLRAEDVVDADLPEFVTYGEPDAFGNREIEGIEYSRLWVLLIPVINQMKRNYETRISMLESDKDYLLSKISNIEAILITKGIM